MRTKRTKPNTPHRPGALLCACGLLAFMAVFALAGASAKYLHKTETQGQAVAAEFYFTSDLLGETAANHTVTALDADGTASVTFRLQNHADELRYAAVDIAYTVTAENTSGAACTVTPDSGKMPAGEGHDAAITLSGLKPGQTYTVTARATAPYTAELTGTVTVRSSNNEVRCTVEDKTQYVEATVRTVDYSGTVQLTYPAGLIPDNTDPLMDGWQTGGDTTKEFTMGPNSAHVFRFFKSADYTGNGSEVTARAQ